MIHSVTGQLVSTVVKMIASCEMDHRSVGFIHPRRSSFIDSNWPSRDFVSSSGVYNSNFYFLLRYAVFLEDFSASSTTSPRWLTQIAH